MLVGVVLAFVAVMAGAIAARLGQTADSGPPAAPAKVVWAVGDGPDGRPQTERVARLIAAGKPDRVLYLGDVYENGTATEYRRNYGSTWGRLAPITAPTPGNHEWGNRDQGYDAYWRRFGVTVEPHYYSFSLWGLADPEPQLRGR